jgi:hypothetical protein
VGIALALAVLILCLAWLSLPRPTSNAAGKAPERASSRAPEGTSEQASTQPLAGPRWAGYWAVHPELGPEATFARLDTFAASCPSRVLGIDCSQPPCVVLLEEWFGLLAPVHAGLLRWTGSALRSIWTAGPACAWPDLDPGRHCAFISSQVEPVFGAKAFYNCWAHYPCSVLDSEPVEVRRAEQDRLRRRCAVLAADHVGGDPAEYFHERSTAR